VFWLLSSNKNASLS